MTTVVALCATTCFETSAQDNSEMAVRDIERAAQILDAAWDHSIYGPDENLMLADSYDTMTGNRYGIADVWPYTAAIEAHCSLLEALDAVRDTNPLLYEENHEKYAGRLALLIDNLDWYRGNLRLSAYACNKEWQPYAVPRGGAPGQANVSGILNVYDDQMWIARELIRAYRLTGNEEWLLTATHLTDYVLAGWDCWRDAEGNEYGGITWGPGYNSKHACSNAPIIQPLVWLAEIYGDSGEETEYYYRDESNAVANVTVDRSALYLDFALRVYDWQKVNLADGKGVYYDMMGADNTIKVSRGYRQHVDCGGRTGTFFSYNTGTMIGGAASLLDYLEEYEGELPDFANAHTAGVDIDRLTAMLRDDITLSARASISNFARYVRAQKSYEFNTDATAENGFNTWFNDVLIRAMADAEKWADNTSATTALESTQNNLDYAWDNYNRSGSLPIHLIDGWGSETRSKAFHQFAFASEYALLSLRHSKTAGVNTVQTDTDCDGAIHDGAFHDSNAIYDLQGRRLREIPDGLYIRNHRLCK
jgi:hypothetical protein